MRKMLTLCALAATLLVSMVTTQAQTAKDNSEALAVIVPGASTYHRPVSTDSAITQQFFDQGLGLTWGFYFPEAIASYQEASRHDPDHPMPYFGLAHAIGPNPNSRYANMPDDPKGAGLKAIRMALSLIKNGSPVEQDMINALYVLYNKDAISDNRTRDFAFIDAMRSLHAKYPQDPDIGSMFAAAYMNAARWDYWNTDGAAKPGTAEARAALEAAMASEHNHPGANHLYIHLMEASGEPELAMPSAQKLENIAPMAGHMVHMPGHIYLRVGEYEKAIYTNERSQLSDLQFAEIWGETNLPNIGTYPLSHKVHIPHALDFVRYANILQGNYEHASEAAVRNAANIVKGPDGIVKAQKRAIDSWLVDKIFAKWDKILAAKQNHSGTPYLDGMWSYVTGSAYVGTDQLSRAEAELANIRRQANDKSANKMRVRRTPASHILKLASFALEGEIKEARGDLDGAIEAYKMAVEIQDANNYTEPPDWTQSMRLYLGAALLNAKRVEDAEAVFLKDLEWNQQNGWATLGLYQALKAQGRTEEATIINRQFQSYWRNADVKLKRARL